MAHEEISPFALEAVEFILKCHRQHPPEADLSQAPLPPTYELLSSISKSYFFEINL